MNGIFLWLVKARKKYSSGLTRCKELSILIIVQFSSVHSVMSDSLRPHESQHARPPCLSPTLRVHSNSCPLSRWCHPTISSSVVPFSSCPQSFPTSGSFQMSQLFTSGGQNMSTNTEHFFSRDFFFLCRYLLSNIYLVMWYCVAAREKRK